MIRTKYQVEQFSTIFLTLLCGVESSKQVVVGGQKEVYVSLSQKQTETDISGQKQTDTDRNGLKRTELDLNQKNNTKTDSNRQKSTETNRNRQKFKKTNRLKKKKKKIEKNVACHLSPVTNAKSPTHRHSICRVVWFKKTKSKY